MTWAAPTAAGRRAYKSRGPQDVVELSGAPRPRSGEGLRKLGMLVGLVLAYQFAGPLAYNLDRIQPDPSEVSVQTDLVPGMCAPSGVVVAGSPEDRAKLDRIGRTLDRYSHRPEVNYRFTLNDMRQPNAETCPDGLIGIDQEVVRELDEQELLFVAAHERGHVERRDHARQHSFQQQAFGRMLGLAHWLPGYEESMHRHLIDVSRENETAADCYGVSVLRAEGIPVEKAGSALQKVEDLIERRLGRRTGANDHTDHPATSERVAHMLNGCSG